MNLQLILGHSGSGKSEYILNQVKKEITLGEKIYIITPEQFSYVTEKKLLQVLGKAATINSEVISFNRTSHRILTEVGGAAKTALSKSGKAMLIYNILEKQKKNLTFLGNSDDNVELMLKTITELKKHNIMTDNLKNVKIDNEYLEMKLQDINTIYSSYEKSISNKYIDEDDNLTILAENLDSSTMFDGATVYIDEFAGFTEQEYSIIKKLFKKARKVSIAICTDTSTFDELTNPELDVFYYNKKAAKKLGELAAVEGVHIESPIILDKSYRFKNNELKHLEQNIYAFPYKKYEDSVNDISLFLAANPYSEIENIAKNIIKLVREDGLKFSDIAVISKNVEELESPAKTIFAKYNIPIFIDRKEDLNQNVLIKYILSVIEIFAKNWSREAVFSYLKSGLYDDIEKEDIYKLENYCLKWGIRGTKWYKEDWTYDVGANGIRPEQTEKNKKGVYHTPLQTLNNIRNKIVTPLLKFKQELEGRKTAKEITTAIYTFLVENKIEEKLNKKIEYFKQINESFLAEEYEKSYEILINLLDEIVLVFGVDKMTFAEYSNVLQTGFKYSDLGKIPEVIDQVVIGDVDRSRTNKTKVLFITGLNDGVFPSSVPAEGFLNDKDRNMLKEKGIELAKTTEEALYEDQFNIYKAFSTAENKVFLSYLSSDKNGRGLRPSILVSRVKRIFPKLKEQSDVISQTNDISVPEPTFDNLLTNLKNLQNGENIDKLWLQVYNWYAENSEWKHKLAAAASGLEYKNEAETLDKDNIKKLYGDTLKTSISRLEQYKKCPFSFYLKYGLKIEEKDEFKIRPIDTGSFMHEVIDEFFETANVGADSTNDEIQEIVTEIIDEKLNQSKNYIFASTPKFIVLTKRLKQVIIKSIQYIIEQMRNSRFTTLGNEVEFKDKIGDVELTGKIDRIDVGESEEGKFIRVIDYKSSSKNIDLNELMAGTQIQLITYIDSISKKENAIPAGMLYFNLIDPVIKSNKNLSDKELEDEIRKNFRMQGLILADVNVIKMMDTSLDKGSSKTIPVSLNADGTIGKVGNSTITKEEFTNLQKSVNKIIKDISKEILKGNIDIKPMYNLKTKTSSCKNCVYKSICGFDANYNNYAFVQNKPKEQILKEIKEEE